MTRPSARLLAGGVLVASAAGLLLAAGTARAASGPTALTGTFTVTAGSCASGTPTGSWFRMILPSGSTTGPFVGNNDSACGDQTYTLLAPGSDGGLVTGAYQPEPTPAFDGSGNSLATRVIAPVSFYGKKFSADTAPHDPQTKTEVSAPSITASGSTLSGDLRAFGASWNTQEFNQGSPKPDGTKPGLTATPTGTYDAATGAYTLQWTSQIVGGPFNSFTGQWRLTGLFHPVRGNATTRRAVRASPATPASAAASRPAATASSAAATSAPPATTGGTGGGGTGAITPVAITGSAPAADPGAATAAGAAPAPQAAAGGDPAEVSSGQVITTATAKANPAHGWRAPVWSILLVAAIGVLGAAVYVALDRALRRSAGS